MRRLLLLAALVAGTATALPATAAEVCSNDGAVQGCVRVLDEHLYACGYAYADATPQVTDDSVWAHVCLMDFGDGLTTYNCVRYGRAWVIHCPR